MLDYARIKIAINNFTHMQLHQSADPSGYHLSKEPNINYNDDGLWYWGPQLKGTIVENIQDLRAYKSTLGFEVMQE